MKTRIWSVLLAAAIIAFACSPAVSFDLFGEKGCKILFVRTEDGENKASEVLLVREALDKGGMITLNTDVAKEIDRDFESKYTATGSDGKYFVLPAILNFVGGQGWTFVQMQLGPQYIFVKNR